MMLRRAGLAGGLALFFATRLVSLPEPIGVDQGIFATAGWAMTRGLTLYRDVWDQKPPGIHLVYAAAIGLAGQRPAFIVVLDALAWTSVALFAALIAARLASRAAAAAVVVVLAVVTFPAFQFPYGGFLERAVPETFVAVLATAAVWATIARRYALAGLLVGAAAVFKPTALVYAPACVAIAWMTEGALRRPAIRMAAAAALPWLAVAAWLALAGTATDARVAIVDYNSGYVAAGSGLALLANRLVHTLFSLVKTDAAWLFGAAGVAAAAIAWLKPSDRPLLPAIAVVWLAAVILAIAANGIRMYGTYFLPASAPLALLGGWFCAEYLQGRRWWIGAAVILLAVAAAWHARTLARAARFVAADVARMRGTLAREPYLELFGGYANGRGYSARANAELSDYLRANAAPGDRLYIFGMAPAVYFLSAELPANRFIWTYPAAAPFVQGHGFGTTALAADLARAAPAWVVLEANNRDSASGWRIEDVYDAPLMRGVLDGYTRAAVIEDFTVLRRSVK